ncbi:hypothetical protein SteCoe_3183 [Stentor coeruleus]|uniref:ATP synthase subunit d, mitochondrial n=1 Tax=Stentor coeruleus TaxID=5963 RepID=A0A1R2CXP1_9CILI|nr:hypothetical protein SteCoe_3183 [Stentor coeruleus]
MALRSVLRATRLNPPTRHKAWVQMLTEKAVTNEDQSSVSALATICDYYAIGIPEEEVKAKNNFQVKWDEWAHLQTPGLVSKLRAKVDAINAEPYETEVLAHEIVSETEALKKLSHIVTYNAVLHLSFVSEKDNLIENIYHAKPFSVTDLWEVSSMYKYDDMAYRWDKELGWIMPNNDQIIEDYCGTNALQFQKDMCKRATDRYCYDFLGRHQLMCTAGKLSQTQRED